MAASDRKDSAVFQPPAWMLAAAEQAKKAAGESPQELAKQVQNSKAEIEANGEGHQKKMRALQGKLSELGADKDWNVFKTAQVEEIGVVAQGKTAVLEVKPMAITTQATSKAGKRKVLAQKPEERRTKKEQVRKKQKEEAEKKAEGLKKQTKDLPVSTVRAQSTTTGALQPGTTTATVLHEQSTKMPDTMATDNNKLVPVPSSNSLVPATDGKEQYPVRSTLPDWYTSIPLEHAKMKAISKKRPQELATLDGLKACMAQCQTANPTQLANQYDNLRDYIHRAEIQLPVTCYLLRKSNMLSPTAGLPLIFAASANFPDDIKSDAFQLYTRWYKGDFDQNILRGIETSKSNTHTGDRIAPAYREKFPASAKYFGQGDLVLGQWWPTQLCALRDGAHGNPQGGIYGEKNQGAYSIILSGGHSTTDSDNGDVIEYSGTEGKNFCPTDVTNFMLLSSKVKNPIRVLRSSHLPKKNPYRPDKGLRYDGLYTVTGVVVTDQMTAMHRFTLERCEGQAEIRYEGKGKRPTLWEVAAYEKLKAESAW
ncbi:SAD/SRA domain containing protein [Pyrenophora tritici-repentis]|nr:SAD/SRA domain containing protein [Pyrenophora tritici-repentis]KAI1668364.1 SAD/SRA domain containing protein [Pyrenophora tritici-repentis]KAI1680887.1 SAD/SRA domain containing protein [Pyrenophora tritici-repentis]